MWLPLSLYFAFWTSISTLIAKRLLKDLHPRTYFLVGNLTTLPFIFLLIMLSGGFPSVSLKFFFLLTASSVLDVVAFFAAIWSVKISPISLVLPISSFNPVFTAIIAMIFLGETPTTLRFAGILLVVAGAYLLNVKDVRRGIFSPLLQLATHRGVQLSFMAYFLWAITPVFQKQAIFETQPTMPLFASFIGSLLVTVFALPFTIRKTVGEILTVRQNISWFLLLAPFSTLAFWAAFTAFSLQNVAYVTAIFKLSVLFTILWGWLFFKEERISERLLGGAVMLLGTLLLIL